MKKNKLGILIMVLCCISLTMYGQQLRRRASFGSLVGDVNDSVKIALKLPSTNGTLIKMVVDSSSADLAGFETNDVLVTFDGEAIENTEVFLRMLKQRSGNDKVTISYFRNGNRQQLEMTLLSPPRESNSAFRTIYSSVTSDGNHLRTIITRPNTEEKCPVVMIVPGVGCYSVDNPSHPAIKGLYTIIDSLTRAGIVTVRVEKSGMGDSKGVPCQDMDFDTEFAGFKAGLKAAADLPYVDRDNIFIFGISMGGIMAPLLAKEVKVKGIIAYGTGGKSWLEYELENSHRQKLLKEYPYDSLDQYMRAEVIRLYHFFIEKRSPGEIMEMYPETKQTFFKYPMKPEYFQQVADIQTRKAWSETNAYVLAIHGSSDYVSDGKEHELIANIVNHNHRGKGNYVELPETDHWMFSAKTYRDSYEKRHAGFNAQIIDIVQKWLKEKSQLK